MERAGNCRYRHAAFRVFEFEHIDRYWLCPSHMKNHKHKQTDNVKMFERIKRESAFLLCGIVAEKIRRISVAQFMKSYAKYGRHNGKEKAHQICEVKAFPY